MEFLKKNRLLIALFLVAAFFHFYALGTPVLDTDEAEVYLAAQSIFESGVPIGFYRAQFYENAYLYEANDSMYQFLPTNYLHTNLVLRKGWMTYYVTAFFSIFGKNEFVLRLPFVIIGLLSMLALYLFSCVMFGRRTALIAAFLYAVSPSLLFYDRTIRYYSPMVLLVLLSSYFFFLAFEKKELKYYILGWVALSLLFHTNVLIFGSLAVAIAAYGLLKKCLWNRNAAYSAAVLAIMIIPWIIATGFFQNFSGEPHNNLVVSEPGFIYHTIISGISNQPLLHIMLYIGLLMLVASLSFEKRVPKAFFWKEKNAGQFIIIIAAALIIFPLMLSPQSSFEEKMFVSVIPFYILIISKSFDVFIAKKKVLFFAVIGLVILSGLITYEQEQSHDNLFMKDIFGLQRENVFFRIEKIVEENTQGSPLVLMTENQFPLMFYTNLTAQTVWPVRKEFIDNYEDELVIVENERADGVCHHFYQYVNPTLRCGNKKNYLGRIGLCEQFAADATTTVYVCQKRTNFEGGNQGLYFSDFPKNAPPDFIWDLEPFPMKANVKNHGESTADKVKIAFSGEFAGKEFDADKKEFIFDEVILPSKEKMFDLGKLTFNHKLVAGQKYVNATVTLCYHYTTKIKVDTCKDEARICGLDVSGAPVQLDEYAYSKLGLNFTITNAADGWIGTSGECGEENATKVIKATSDAFRCEPERRAFICEGVQSRIKKDSTYFIEISYDYQQEFKKSILLRSIDKNKNDYESSK